MTTKIMLCENPLRVSDAVLLEYVTKMDDERKNKAYKYHFRKDWAMCIIAYALLEEGVKEIYGWKRLPAVNWGKKPHFVHERGVFFNISHCETVVACAISDCEIGIDVQNDDHLLFDAGKSIFSKEELARLDSIEQDIVRIRAYRQMWVRKEAYGKFMGYGLQYDTKISKFESNDSIYESDKNAYSLCAVGNWNNVDVKRIEF